VTYGNTMYQYKSGGGLAVSQPQTKRARGTIAWEKKILQGPATKQAAGLTKPGACCMYLVEAPIKTKDPDGLVQ
jgi:hypothetical protein